MKELTLFYLEDCPYCKRAISYMEELCAEDPRYAALPVKRVEERRQKELADRFDYYYVPCYFLDGKKLAEGSIDKEGVRRVFDAALE